MTLGTSMALVAVLAVLTALHVAYWRHRLAAPSREDEVLRAATHDGWSLALGRRVPRGAPRRPPVLFVHGIAMNRQAFDFGVERYSLCAYLARSGFDCFALDLRGAGGSRDGPEERWNLDAYVREDVPAAIAAIRAATGEDEVLFVGHSLGALVGMAACALHGSRIRGLVALAPAENLGSEERLWRLLRLRRLGVGRVLRLLAHAAAPFSGFWHPELLELSFIARNVERPVIRRLLANAVENLQPGVLDQLAALAREGSFRSEDGVADYRALLSSCRQPALFVSAGRDGLARPAAVEGAFRRWGGPKVLWSAGAEIGHLDLLLGRDAPDVVFPKVRDFLVERSGERGEGRASRGQPTG